VLVPGPSTPAGVTTGPSGAASAGDTLTAFRQEAGVDAHVLDLEVRDTPRPGVDTAATAPAASWSVRPHYRGELR
jgi:hypothetical protein